MNEGSAIAIEFLKKAQPYCEWIGQKSFTYPNWNDSRESFLNEQWPNYIGFAVSALGNPFNAQPQDLIRVISNYQDNSYLNSLTRVYQNLIANEIAEKEKVIWTGFIEDSGAKSIRNMGIEARKPTIVYLVITNKSLLIKTSNHPLSQKFSVNDLELEPIQRGFRFLKKIQDFNSENLSSVIFSTQGTLNGQEVQTGTVQYNEYSENYYRLVAAFALAKNFFNIQLELIGEHLLIETIPREEDTELLSLIWSYLVEGWGYGTNMIDNDLEILIGLAKNIYLEQDCLDEMIRFELQFIMQSRRNLSEIREWLVVLSNRPDLSSEQQSLISEIKSKLGERVQR